MRRIIIYIYQQANWTNFTWDNNAILPLLGKVRYLQGKLIGKMQAIGFELNNEAFMSALSTDIIKSSEIEGEFLKPQQVRSSVARKLGLDISGLIPSNRNVDGMVDMLFDATQNYQQELTQERLFAWHSALFPTIRSSLFSINVGKFRDDSKGPMQVVSGVVGKQKVHYQAPAAKQLNKEIALFLNWFNTYDNNDAVIKAAIAHLWFITLHPFDDGNGRMARAITDRLLAKADGSTQRFYSMSAQIQKQRNEYYNILEQTQKGTTDITGWMVWFLSCLHKALVSSDGSLKNVTFKHDFWSKHNKTTFNQRQLFILKILLDGYDKKLNSSTWAKLSRCSTDTALRDIQDLVKKDILTKSNKGGRSTAYRLNTNSYST